MSRYLSIRYTLVSPLIERTFALLSDNLPEANLFAGLQRGVPGSMLLSIYCCSDLFPSRRTFLSCRSPVDGKYRELETGEHSTQAPAF